jgi:hypothetical protein
VIRDSYQRYASGGDTIEEFQSSPSRASLRGWHRWDGNAVARAPRGAPPTGLTDSLSARVIGGGSGVGEGALLLPQGEVGRSGVIVVVVGERYAVPGRHGLDLGGVSEPRM